MIAVVSCDDSNAVCRCEACGALRVQEGCETGPLLAFVNSVADAVAAKYPQVRVSTLAYWHTDRPPATIAPRPNVLVQLGNLARHPAVASPRPGPAAS